MKDNIDKGKDLEAPAEERTPDGYLDPVMEAIDKDFQAQAVSNTQDRADATGLESSDVVVVESAESNEVRPATEDELQQMLRDMAVAGVEPKLDDLQLSE
jgi:hypothetical protein